VATTETYIFPIVGEKTAIPALGIGRLDELAYPFGFSYGHTVFLVEED